MESAQSTGAGSYPILEPLEMRLLLSGTMEQNVLLALSQSEGQALPAGVEAMIPLDAAGDDTDGFAWTGWQEVYPGGDVRAAVLTYSFQGPPAVEGPPDGVTVGLPGTDTWRVEGEPVLPVRQSWILLPQGAEIASVDVDLGPGEMIAADVDLARTGSGEVRPAPEISFSTHDMCGYRLGLLSVFPVQHDGPSGDLTYHQSVSVTLQTQGGEARDAVGVRAVVADVERAVERVDNASELRSYRMIDGLSQLAGGTLPPGGPFEYVIITSSDLADEFQPLVDQKTSRGLAATIVTTDYIYANFTGLEAAGVRDNADRIRDFIYTAYHNWNTVWVLLGGDTDGFDTPGGTANAVVPHRGAKGGWDYDPPSIDNNIPTDLYFSCLGGTWNGDGDSIWGEKNDGSGGGDVDLVPEVFVGRAPVSNAAEATNFVNKTILYERTPHPNAKWAVFLGEEMDRANQGPGHADVWGSDTKDLAETHSGISSAPHNWTLTKRYDRDYPDDPSSWWTGEDLIDYLDANVHVVNHAGHSNWPSNAKITSSDVDGLVNTHPYFFYSYGCLSGAFDRSDSIAEHHVKGAHGAVGVVMNSRVGRDINPNSANGKLDQEFWHGVFQLGRREFGRAFDYARSQVVPPVESVAGRWQYFCWTLFADPETSLAYGGSPGAIAGTVYEDHNGDGVMGPDDSGRSGRTVYADVDNDGVRDSQWSAVWSDDMNVPLPDLATTTSTATVGGLSGRILDLDVRLSINHTYDADLDVYLYNSGGTRVELFTDVGGSGDNFVNTFLDDEASTAITAGSAPFSGWYRPEEALSAFDGLDPNGLWTLEITDDASGDTGTLVSWSLQITYGDPSAETNVNGDYTISHLAPGDYVVRDELPSGWVHTSPESGAQNVVVSSGLTTGDVDFGTARPARIMGRRFHDFDGDGHESADEPGLPGGMVYLDYNINGRHDVGEPDMLTDSNGWYDFQDVSPGSYVVREEPFAGWMQTAPGCGVLYGVAPFVDSELVVIDLETFGGIAVGATGQTKTIGLASDGAGTLYSIPAVGYFNRWLYSVNPITGQATELFDLGITSLLEGGLALAPDGKTIYAARTYPSFDANLPPELVRIDLDTQATTVLGQLTIAGSPFPNGTHVDGLAFRGNTLYGLVTEAGGNLDDHLIIIDTSTLAVTDVRATGRDFSLLAGLAYDPRRDVFYASGRGQGALLNLCEISPQTAQAWSTQSTGLLNLSGLTYGTSRGTPLAGAHVVFAASGSTVYADFGDALPVGIHGSKWHDENGNGRQDPGEPGLAGWDVYLDENNNDLLDDASASVGSADAPKPLADLATTISTLSVKDVVGRITDVNVHLDITHTFDGDLEAVLVSPAGTRVQLFFRVGGDGDNFTDTTLDDEAATPIGSGSPPFSGSFEPAEALSLLDGEDPNGIWSLEITDHARGDAGTLNEWSLSLWCAERSARTNADGGYEFVGLNPGGYDVREVRQAGWVRTAPGAVPILIDDFEDGDLLEYTQASPGSPGFTNPFAAHDGGYGAVGMNWMYRDDPAALVERGDVISAWVRFANNATGRAALGFGMSATHWYSLQLQPEFNILDLYQYHGTGSYLFGASEQVYLPDKWYRVEVVWGTSGAIEGRLYDSDGVTLLNTVTGYDTTITWGGIGFVGWGEGGVRQFDTITRWRDGAHHIVVTSGGAAGDVNFGNAQPGSIQGTKYHDRNGSRTRDGAEEGLPAWLMYIDAEDDFLIDSDSDIVASADVPRPLPDKSTSVSALRVHQMSGLILDVNVGLNISHTYDADLEVYLIGPLGTRVELFSNVGGSGDNFTNTILDDQATDPITSGSAPFTGTFRPEGLLSAFNGQDPNGIWRLEVIDGAAGDTGTLNNWWLQIWHGDPFVLTDADGDYSFGGLTPGEYVTRELAGFAFGWLQTAPLMGADYTPVTSGQTTGGTDFGNALPGSISGFKYEDTNGSGGYDSGEPKLPNWTIFLDMDNNGVLDENRQAFVSEHVPRPIPDEGAVASTLPVTGLAGRILDVDVHLDITHTFDGDLEVYLYSPAGTQVELFTAVGGSGENFTGTILDDEAGTSIAAGAAPFTGRFRPEGSLSALDGERVNGTWVLEVRDTVAGDVGTLDSWSIDLAYGDPSAETDAGGNYTLGHLMPGEFILREVQQAGWVQTDPAAGAHVFELASDDDLSNVNFGNQRQPSPPPDRPDLLPGSDTGVPDDDFTRLDNSTPSEVLQFAVGGTVPGATVTIHADGAAIGSAVAAGTTTIVTTNGSHDLADGEHGITARQTVPGEVESLHSPALTVWIDTQPPAAAAWHSAAEHGHGVGEALLEIPDDGSFGEPRMAGVARLKIDFSEAIDPASWTRSSVRMAGNDADGDPVDLSGIAVATSAAGGDTVGIIDFTPALPDALRCLVQIEAVTDVAGNPLAGDNNRVFTALAGDATGDRRVNAIDLSYIWPRRTTLIDGVSEDQTRSDVTCDGRINAIDLSAAWPRRGANMRDVPDPVLPPAQRTVGLPPAGPGTLAEAAAMHAALAGPHAHVTGDSASSGTAEPHAPMAMPPAAAPPPARPATASVVTVPIETEAIEAAREPGAPAADLLDVLALSKLLPPAL